VIVLGFCVILSQLPGFGAAAPTLPPPSSKGIRKVGSKPGQSVCVRGQSAQGILRTALNRKKKERKKKKIF
jgi:hypothetical protein